MLTAQYHPFTAWRPDDHWENEGAVTTLSNLMPTSYGYTVIRNNVDAIPASTFPNSVFPEYVGNAWKVRLVDGTYKIVAAHAGAGTVEFSSDFVQRTSLLFPDTVTDPFELASIAQWGNDTIITTLANGMQIRDAAGVANFAPLGGGSPRAKLITTIAPNFVMAANYQVGIVTTPDGWWCSAIGNHLSWTPSTATQAANGRLLGTSGPIRALATLGDRVIAYKDRAIYIGQYVGAPVIWRWSELPGRAGAISNSAVASTGGVHYYRSADGFYKFDGNQVTPIDDGIRNYFNELFFQTGTAPGRFSVQAQVDDYTQTIRFHCYYKAVSDVADTANRRDLTHAFIYHIPTGRWGHNTTNTRRPVLNLGNGSGGLGEHDLFAVSTNFGGLPSTLIQVNTRDVQTRWQAGSIGGQLITADYTDAQLARVIPRADLPLGSTMTYYRDEVPFYRPSSGTPTQTQLQTTYAPVMTATTGLALNPAMKSFDYRANSREHRFEFVLPADSPQKTRLQGYTVQFAQAGRP
jgi:hypothetical protein